MHPLETPPYNFTVRRGDTFETDSFSLPESVSPDLQAWEVEKGIADGSIILEDWQEYEITADVKINGELWFRLTDYLKLSDKRVRFWFEFTADETRNVLPPPDKPFPVRGLYDLQICKNGNVQTLISGFIELIPDITDVASCERN